MKGHVIALLDAEIEKHISNTVDVLVECGIGVFEHIAYAVLEREEVSPSLALDHALPQVTERFVSYDVGHFRPLLRKDAGRFSFPLLITNARMAVLSGVHGRDRARVS